MARNLDEHQIVDVIWGATLLGGGGGGSMQNGMDLLEQFKKEGLGPLNVNLITREEMEPGKYAAVTAGMGAPTVLKTLNFYPYVINAFAALKEMAAKLDEKKDLEYSMAVELGGFNTFVPMLISLVEGVPFVDADGAGRAVPALDTLLLHINGLNTSPLAMANGNGDKVTIVTTDPRDAGLAEEIGRHICMAFGMVGGLSGWMINKDEVAKVPEGTVTKCEKIGADLREHAGKKDDVFEFLKSRGHECRTVVPGICKVLKIENKQAKGFDYGEVTVAAEDGKEIKIFYQNENLLITVGGEPYVTIPEIIAVVNAEDGVPLTNADIQEGQEVFVGVVKTDEKWDLNPDMFDVWGPFMDNIGYKGQRISY